MSAIIRRWLALSLREHRFGRGPRGQNLWSSLLARLSSVAFCFADKLESRAAAAEMKMPWNFGQRGGT